MQSAYVTSSDGLQLTSTQHRSQAQNVDDCLEKVCELALVGPFSFPAIPPRFPFFSLQTILDPEGQRILNRLLITLYPQLKSLILNAALADIKNEPTEAQKTHVKNLVAVEKARRRRDKEHHSQTKQWRKKGDWD